jgi:hypothetical protein
MNRVVFRYRCRELDAQSIAFIRATVAQHYAKGRSHISRVLCKAWGWVQPNGKLKEYAARDLLLRLEENGLVKLPPRLRPKNNLKRKSFDQIPLFIKSQLGGSVGDYPKPTVRLAKPQDSYLWDYLLHHYHYLGLPKLVGAHLKHLVLIDAQVVACIGWASAAWKVKDRDTFIGWDESIKRKNLYLIGNNVRFLILPWVRVKDLASKALSLSLRL